MLKDKINNYQVYANLEDDIKTGLKWLKETALAELPCGRYEIDNNRIYANIQEYTTKTEAKYEAHKKYIDIQCVIKGCESVGVTYINNCTNIIPYDKEKDIEFLDITTNDTYITLEEGDFLILYPEDAHKPSMAFNNTPSFVKKAVVKVSIE